MKIKEAAIGIASRILRFTGILLLIYISMVFYLALTERRNAFPRAITHNEARAAIADKAKNISCTLNDGSVLEGFVVGNEQDNIFLYYPDANEDAAQFLAELDSLHGYAVTTFNYRGSGENKGTPSQETFESDAQMIYECASQINGRAPEIVAGRGIGAILATKQDKNTNLTILIDPVISIADVISEKYRLLYPKFLVRTDVKIDTANVSKQKNIVILFDRVRFSDRNHTVNQALKAKKYTQRATKSLSEAIFYIISRK